MEFIFENVKSKIDSIIKNGEVDLTDVDFVDPWAIILICLALIERHNLPNKKLYLPKNNDLLYYLKRMHFGRFIQKIGYSDEAQELDNISMVEKNSLNVYEIIHCGYRDEFDGRLGKFIPMFENFGLGKVDARKIASLIGELGNNTFDHNLGNWPSDIYGCIIAAQNYPALKKIQIVVGDPGVGFLNSLKVVFPDLNNDLDAIQKGLAGYTGRKGENRGNGLRVIQNWTIEDFSGILTIQSGSGMISVGKDGMKKAETKRILGTLAQIMINYK